MPYQLSILGCGNMCGSLLQGMLNKNMLLPQEIIIKNSSLARSQIVAKKFQVQPTDNTSEIETANLIMLGIKPQRLADISLEPAKDSTIISVLAGVTTGALAQKFNTKKIVRVMPNMAAKVNAGLAGMFFTPAVSAKSRAEIIDLLGASGETLILNQEKHMDRFSVLSGALIGILGFWEHNFAEYNNGLAQQELKKILVELSGEKFFDEDSGAKIINQTFLGYQAVRSQTGISAREMQQKVSSKGGVTEEMTNFLSTDDTRKAQQDFFRHPQENSQFMKKVLQKMFEAGEKRSLEFSS